MIRKMKNININRVADIWLKTNLKAHYFIPEQYWTSNYELVKEMLLQAEVYVYEDNKMIQGFVGLSNEYIEGIFVSDEMQSSGIGKLLLDYIKNKKVRLRLNVYQKNTRRIPEEYQKNTRRIPELSLFTKEKGSISNAKDSMVLLVKKNTQCCGSRNRKQFLGENFIWSSKIK